MLNALETVRGMFLLHPHSLLISYAYCPFHWNNKSPVRVNTNTISSFLVSYLVSSVPLLVSLSLFTKDVSRGEAEETRGERNQGNRDLINETSFALEPHFKKHC